MNEKDHLYVLWTNKDVDTAEKMVFMYTVNALKYHWWKKVTIIIWGATAELVGSNVRAQKLVEDALAAGVHVSACRACADDFGVAKKMEDLGIEVIYWGEPLTTILKNDEKLLTL